MSSRSTSTSGLLNLKTCGLAVVGLSFIVLGSQIGEAFCFLNFLTKTYDHNKEHVRNVFLCLNAFGVFILVLSAAYVLSARTRCSGVFACSGGAIAAYQGCMIGFDVVLLLLIINAHERYSVFWISVLFFVVIMVRIILLVLFWTTLQLRKKWIEGQEIRGKP
ncbi:hypothetical protein L596_009895 [Steinernema carpocapsae]|uniref:Uncharacterized protein n=1 Tax=Steinernema carpocapsae TaxID=34508 RepID=A0A4U5PHH4_STECR|nr:hypothetical protein L596_009895 [Steinernema carpocapsae]